jgi:hypothetical protein
MPQLRVDADIHRWVVSPDVLFCSDGHETTLLSVRSGRYYTLNDVAGYVWQCLPERVSISEMSARVARQFGETERLRQVESDVRELIVGLERNRLVVRDSGTQPKSPESNALSRQSHAIPRGAPRLPSRFACATKLICVHILLRFISLRTVLTLIHRVAGAPRYFEPCEDWVTGAPPLVSWAGAVYPFRTLCLERSVCLLWVARSAGLDARLRLGVLQSPFSAHAWVEYGGKPLNETREQLRLYRVFPELKVPTRGSATCTR